MRTKPTLRNKLAVLLVLLVMLACNVPISWTDSLAPGGTWYVDKTGDDSNDCLSASSACLTINAAVSKALTGGVIQIGPGIFEEISTSDLRYGLYINNKVLTFRGTATGGVPETILSGAHARTTVEVTGSAIVIFEDLIIQDGGGSSSPTHGLVIQGGTGTTAGAELTNVIIRGNDDHGLLISGRAPVTLDNVQVLNNGEIGLLSYGPTNITIKNSTFSGNDGGAIRNDNLAKMVISDTTISDNGSSAITNTGDVSIERSTISGTTGVGIVIYNNGALTMVNSTVAANSGSGIELVNNGALKMNFSTVAENGEYGLNLTGGDVVIYNSIIENNALTDCFTADSRVSGLWSNNFSDGTCSEPYPSPDPYLGHLADNDGPTQTMALAWGSPAINRGGGPGVDPDTDQRGFPRPGPGDGGTADSGAYEYDGGSVIAPLEFVTPSGVVPLYTDTPAPKTPIILTFTKNAYCRKGPSTLYRDISSFKQGETAQADGRNDADPRWWQVLIPNSDEHCWVSHVTVETNDLAEGLPIQTVSLELPEAPSDFFVANRACTGKSYSLRLAWTKSPDADGYILYRNGEESATFKANKTSFEESPPMNQYLLYELAAFNADGYSERLALEDNCP